MYSFNCYSENNIRVICNQPVLGQSTRSNIEQTSGWIFLLYMFTRIKSEEREHSEACFQQYFTKAWNGTELQVVDDVVVVVICPVRMAYRMKTYIHKHSKTERGELLLRVNITRPVCLICDMLEHYMLCAVDLWSIAYAYMHSFNGRFDRNFPLYRQLIGNDYYSNNVELSKIIVLSATHTR